MCGAEKGLLCGPFVDCLDRARDRIDRNDSTSTKKPTSGAIVSIVKHQNTPIRQEIGIVLAQPRASLRPLHAAGIWVEDDEQIEVAN